MHLCLLTFQGFNPGCSLNLKVRFQENTGRAINKPQIISTGQREPDWDCAPCPWLASLVMLRAVGTWPCLCWSQGPRGELLIEAKGVLGPEDKKVPSHKR